MTLICLQKAKNVKSLLPSFLQKKDVSISLPGVETDPLVARNAGAAVTEPVEKKHISNNRRKILLPKVKQARHQISGLLLMKWSFDDIAEIFQASEFHVEGWELEIVYNEFVLKKS